MVKLTDTQLIVLSKAAASEDGAAIVPDRMTKAAAVKVGSSLVARKLMREIRAKPTMGIWREDENGRSLSLVITRAGHDAIGAEEGDESTDASKAAALAPKMQGVGRGRAPQSDTRQASTVHAQLGCSLPRDGSKQAMIITMLQKSKGASLEALIEATGWLPHTTRAALTGLRKRGFAIERIKGEAGPIYRIITPSKAAA